MAGERLKQAIKGGLSKRWELRFPSKYLRAADVDGRDHVWVTIKDLDPNHTAIGSNGESKQTLAMYFEKTDKALILNKTNCKMLSKLFGNDLTDWIGQKIALGTEMVSAFGETKEALRVRSIRPSTNISNDDLNKAG